MATNQTVSNIWNFINSVFIDKISFSRNELKELSDYSKSIGLDFCSTPYSYNEVDFLVSEKNVPYIKVASMDLNNYRFLSYGDSSYLEPDLKKCRGSYHSIIKNKNSSVNQNEIVESLVKIKKSIEKLRDRI